MAKTQALISKEWHAATLDEMCGTELLHSPALMSTEDVSAPLAEDVASLLVLYLYKSGFSREAGMINRMDLCI